MFSSLRNSDARHVQAVLRGDTDAYANLVKSHWATARAIAFAKVQNDADADDIAQTAFVRAYEKLDTLTNPALFRPWLGTITRNAAVSLLRMRKETVPLSESLPSQPSQIPEEDIREVVRAKLNALDENHREILLLHYDAGLNVREIGESLNITTEAAKKRLQRARSILGESLAKTLEPQDRNIDSHVTKILALVAATSPGWMATAQALGWATGGVALLTGSMMKWGAAAVVVAGVGASVVIASDPIRSRDTAQPDTTRTTNTAAANAVSMADAIEAPVAASPSDDSEVSLGISGSTFSGTLHDVDGSILPNHLIQYKQTSEVVTEPQETLSDDQGVFSVPVTGSADLLLMATGEGMMAARVVRFDKLKDEPYVLSMKATGVLEGSVVDVTGQPIPDVVIELDGYGADGLVYEAWSSFWDYRTNERGHYRIPHIWTPSSGIDFSHPDYAHDNRRDFDVYAGRNELNITLEKGANLSGKVVNHATGKPVSGAKVRLAYEESTYVNPIETNSDGAFSFENVRPGKCGIVVAHDVFAQPAECKVTLRSGETEGGVTIPLRRGGVLRGRIVASDSGEGLGKASVYFHSPSLGYLRTDRNGYFTARALKEGEYRVYQIDHPKLQTHLFSNDPVRRLPGAFVAWGEHVELPDIALEIGQSIAGQVVAADGSPVASARVFITLTEEQTSIGKSLRTDEHGRFQIPGVTSGKVVAAVAVTDEYSSNTFGPVVASSEPIDNVLLTLKDVVVSLSGQVMWPDRSPIAHQIMRLFPKDFAGPSATVRTDEQGAFKASGLLAGEYRVQFETARVGGQSTITPQGEFTIPTGVSEHYVDLITGSESGALFSGRIENEQGDPVRGARIEARAMNVRFGNRNRTGRSQADGTFVISGLNENADLRVRVEQSDYMYYESDAFHSGDQNAVIVLRERPRIRGRVLDARTRKPVKVFSVGVGGNLEATQDANGAFEVYALREGEVTVSAVAEDYGVESLMVPVGSENVIEGVEILLAPEATIDGQVVDSMGVPMADALVFKDGMPMYDDIENLEAYPGTNPRALRTDANGRFTIGNLSAGEIPLYAHAPDMIVQKQVIRIETETRNPVTFIMEPGGIARCRLLVDGEPIKAKVKLEPLDHIGQDDSAHLFRHSNDEEALFRGLPGGRWRLSAEPSDREEDSGAPILTRDIIIVPEETTEVDIHYDAGTAAIEGTIVGDMSPYRSIVTYFRFADPQNGAYGSAVVRNGVFRFDGLPAGLGKVSIAFDSEPHRPSIERDVQTAPGRVTPVQFDLNE